VTFQSPTEIQKVRTISTSLNELAKLHILNGNDRSAMDSYREALEILSAATENEGVDEDLDGEPLEDGDLDGESLEDGELRIDCDEEEDRIAVDASGEYGHGETDTLIYSEEGSRGVDAPPSVASPRQRLKDAIPSSSAANKSSPSSTMSPIQVDLANTLMNVGNFHLRRDELEAALNAYSTVWALYSGNSFENGHETPPLTPATPSEAGSASIAHTTASLPAYLTTPSNGLTTPQQSQTPKSLSSFTSPCCVRTLHRTELL